MESVRRRASSDIVSVDQRENGEENGKAVSASLSASFGRTRSQRGLSGFLAPKLRASSGMDALQRQGDNDEDEETEIWEDIQVFGHFKEGTPALQIFPLPQDPSGLPITSRLRQNFKRSRPDYVEDSECENGHDDDDDDHDSTIDDDESDFEFAYKCSVCFKRFKDVLTLRAHSMIHLFEKKSSGELLKVKEETTPTVKPEVKDSNSNLEPEPATLQPVPAEESVPIAAEPPAVVSTVKPLIPAPLPELSRIQTVMPKTWAPAALPTNVTLAKMDSNRLECRRYSIYDATRKPYLQKPFPVKKPLTAVKATLTEVITISDSSSSEQEDDVITIRD